MTPLWTIPLHGVPCVAFGQPAHRVEVYPTYRIAVHTKGGGCEIGNYRGPHAPTTYGGRPYNPNAVRHNRRKGAAA